MSKREADITIPKVPAKAEETRTVSIHVVRIQYHMRDERGDEGKLVRNGYRIGDLESVVVNFLDEQGKDHVRQANTISDCEALLARIKLQEV